MSSPESPYTSRLIGKTLSRESNRPPNEEIERALARLRIPLSDADFSQAGEHNFSYKNLKFSLVIEDFAIEDIPTLFGLVREMILERGWDANTISGIKNGEYKNMKSLAIENTADGEEYELVPANYVVFINPSSNHLEQASLFPTEKIIIVHGNPSQPEVILNLLHEVGHIYAPQDTEQQSSLSDIHPAAKLFSERNTNAFVLNWVREFVPAADTELRNAIIAKVSHRDQASYDRWALQKLHTERNDS